MGKLYFKVGADYDKVIRLREECKRLEAQLISMNKNLDPKAFREVEKQMQSTKKEYMAIATEAGRAGAEMGEKLKRQIFDSSKAVNTMSEKISDQRVKTRDLSIEVRTLAESYRTMDKSNPQRTALKSQLDAVRASLTKEKDTLFGLQTEQGKNRLSVKKLRDEYALYDDKVRSTVTTNNHLGTSFKSILAGAGIVFSAQQAFQLAKSIVQVRGEFQQLDVAFTTLLQSKEKANILMGQMTELAAKTPFSLMEVATGAKQLTAYGFKAEEITGTLSRLGDIASGLGLPMERLTYLYGTTMTQGRLYARDLMQFTTSGIPMLQGLADMYGVTTEEVNKMVSAGTIGFPEVKKVIENLTNEGGKFFNLMEEQSKTITGKISNLGDAIDIMFNKMGQSQEGVINGAIDSAKYLVENYEDILKIIQSLVVAYGSYKAVLIATVAIQKASAIADNIRLVMMFRKELGLLTAAQQAFNIKAKANPYALLASIIVIVISAVSLFTEKIKTATEVINDLSNANKSFSESGEGIIKLSDEYNLLNSKTDKTTEETKRLNEVMIALNTSVPNAALKFDEYGNILEVNTKKIKDFTDAQKEAARREVEEAKKVAEERARQINNQINKEQQIFLKGEGTRRKRVLTADGRAQEVMETETFSYTESERNAAAKRANVLYAEQQKLLTEIANSEKILKGLRASDEDEGKVSIESTYAEDYKAAKADWEQKKKILTEIEKDKTKFTTKAYEDAKNDEDVAKKKYSSLGGETSDKKTDKTLDNATKASEALINAGKALESERIAVLEDGIQKRLKLTENEHKNKVASIDKEQTDLSAKYKDVGKKITPAEVAVFDTRREVAEEDYSRKKYDIEYEYFEMTQALYSELTDVFLTEEERKQKSIQDRFDKMRNKVNDSVLYDGMSGDESKKLYAEITKAQKQAETADLLKEFETYQQKRERIKKEYDDKIAKLDKVTQKANIEEAHKQQTAALANLDKSIEGSTSLLSKLFADASQKSVNEIKRIITSAEALYEYLGNTSDSDIVAGFGLSAERLKELKNSPKDIEAIAEAIKKLKGDLGKDSPFVKFGDDIKTAIGDIKTGLKGDEFDKDGKLIATSAENIGKGMIGIGGAISSISPHIKQFGDDLSTIFGDSQIGEDIGILTTTLTGLGTAVGGVGKIMSGDILGGVTSIVSGAASIFKMANEAAQRHKEALEAVMDAKIAQQREYNLMLIEQNLLYEKGITIFGNDPYGEAINSVKEYKKIVAELNEEIKGDGKQQKRRQTDTYFRKQFGIKETNTELKNQYAGLADMKIVTGHQKTGLFGWGKGKDTYSSVLDAYPKLIDAQGKFDAEVAKTIISTHKMDDTTKNSLQNCIKLAEQQKEAQGQLNDYLTGIFGELGNTMSNALVDAFENGTDAGEVFADSVGSMLENLAEQMIYSVTIAPLMEKAQADMLGIMNDDTLSDKDRFKKQAEIIAGLTKDAIGMQDTVNGLLQEARDVGKSEGLDLFTPEAKKQSATSKGFETMSQETASKLDGSFLSLRITAIDIRNQGLDKIKLLSKMDVNLGQVLTVSNETKSFVEEIKNIQRDSFYELQGINKNTGTMSKTLDKMADDIRIMKDKL